MRVLVYGAGAVGSLVGAALARGGAQVVLLGRAAHVTAAARQGLRLDGPKGRALRIPVCAATRAEDLDGPFPVVLVTVKGYDTARAAPEIASLLDPHGRAVCVQNGVGQEEALAEVVGEYRVVAAALTASVSLAAPGCVVQHTRGGVALAPWEGAPVKDLAWALRKGGMGAACNTDARSLKWSKLLLNLVANATSAVLDLPPKAVYEHRGLFALERQMLLEALAVGEALGVRWVNLPGFPVRALVAALRLPESLGRVVLLRAVSRGRGTKMPSLWYDLPRGRTEVGFLNGAVARYGTAVGVPTPVNQALTRLVQDLAAGRRDAQMFRGQPATLIRELQG